MDETLILSLTKARLGISTTVRDAYLLAIVRGALKKLTDEQGIVLDPTNDNHRMFVVDYSAWKYESKNSEAMPRHLQHDLHNLIIHSRRVV